MEPRITLITLGVDDLPASVAFFRNGLGWPTNYTEGDPVAFFNTSGTRLALFPLCDLAADISPEITPRRAGFSGITLAHNVREREEVALVLSQAEQAGATVVKPAHDTEWGGHAGYFRDLDGHYWEIAWNPGLPLDADGVMQLGLEG